ncbi:hypothetical protein MRX96_033093 [Rhipicephalus microplus]
MAEQLFVCEDGDTVVLPANIYGTPRLDEGVLYVNSKCPRKVAVVAVILRRLTSPYINAAFVSARRRRQQRGAAQRGDAPTCELSECDLWPRPKVLRFLQEYKTFKNNPKNRLKLNRQMFEDSATVLNKHFPGRAVTGSQVENKWRTLKRSYLGTHRKNTTSRHGCVTCEYES